MLDKIGIMDIIQVQLIMEIDMSLGNIITMMETDTKVVTIKILGMDMESTIGVTEQNMKVIGKMVK